MPVFAFPLTGDPILSLILRSVPNPKVLALSPIRHKSFLGTVILFTRIVEFAVKMPWYATAPIHLAFWVPEKSGKY
jgi:hypothetical protein